MLFGRLRLKRSDPESLAASCGHHKVQSEPAAASCGRHKVQSEPAAASCGRHKVHSEPAAASCGRHKVPTSECDSVVWSPQSAACDLRRRCVVTTNSCRRIAAALCGRNIPSAAVAVIIPFKLPWFNISLFLVLYTLYIYTRARRGGG